MASSTTSSSLHLDQRTTTPKTIKTTPTTTTTTNKELLHLHGGTPSTASTAGNSAGEEDEERPISHEEEEEEGESEQQQYHNHHHHHQQQQHQQDNNQQHYHHFPHQAHVQFSSGSSSRSDSRQDSIPQSGFGWFEDEGMGSMDADGGGNYGHDDDKRGRSGSGHEHISVLSRMETFRESMVGGFSIDMDGLGDTAAMREAVARAQEQGEGGGGGKQILFHLPQKDFAVMTRQFQDFALTLSQSIGDETSDYGGIMQQAADQQQQHHQKLELKKKTSTTTTTKKKGSSYFLALGMGGFRICQTSCGGQHAEFLVCLCINQETHVSWKRYTQFAQLLQQAQARHTKGQLHATNQAWQVLQQHRRWTRCLKVAYLAEKLGRLEGFLEELITEMHSPALLVQFASEGRERVDHLQFNAPSLVMSPPPVVGARQEEEEEEGPVLVGMMDTNEE